MFGRQSDLPDGKEGRNGAESKQLSGASEVADGVITSVSSEPFYARRSFMSRARNQTKLVD